LVVLLCQSSIFIAKLSTFELLYFQPDDIVKRYDLRFNNADNTRLLHLAQSVVNNVNVCPNGVVFVKQHVRKGILPRYDNLLLPRYED